MSEHDSKKKELLPIKELYKNSWIVYRHKIKTIIYLWLFGLVPSFLAAALLSGVAMVYDKNPNYPVIIAIAALILGLPLFYISLRVNIAIFLVISRDIKKPWEAWGTAKKYFWPYTLTTFWMGLLLTLLFLALAIPGFIFLVFYSLAIWVFFMEGYHGYQALWRSKELVTGHWWSLFWRLLVLFVPYIILVSIFDDKKDGPSLIQSLIDFFYSIFIFIFTLRLYKNLRRIKGPSTLKRKKYGLMSYILVIIGFVLLMTAIYVAMVWYQPALMWEG